MKLYAREGSFHAQKVLVAAQYANASVAVETNAKEKDLKGKAAADRLPLLETSEGCLFGSNAMMRFLSKPEMTGKTAMEKAQIDSWMDFGLNEVETPAMCLTYPVIGWMENHPEVTKRAMDDLKAALTVLENHLKLETFLVGRQVTLADIAVAVALVLPMKISLGEKERKAFPCVTRWFTTCVNQPEFVKVVGPVTLPKKAVAAKAPAVAKAPAPKKEEAAPAPAAEEEAPKKPAKNPLDELPKSSFVLDSWKRYYSNSRDLYNDAMKWFWENLDKEGYSIYRSTYNYADELKIDFQVSNLVTGFVQRCDEVRKYAFGTMNIVGQNGGPMQIHGMWLIRGSDIKPLLEANPDAEYHTWTKMEKLDDAEKQEIAHCWCAEEELYGKPILDCKVFK